MHQINQLDAYSFHIKIMIFCIAYFGHQEQESVKKSIICPGWPNYVNNKKWYSKAS